MSSKYFVLSKKWDSRRKCQVTFVAGIFDSYVEAELYAKAYFVEYSSKAIIIDEYELFNVRTCLMDL